MTKNFNVALVAALLAVVVVAVHAQSPPFTCTYTDDASGLRYDLSRLWRAPGVADFAFSAPNFQYAINICGNTNTQCYPDAGVCQTTQFGPMGAGSAAQAVWGAFCTSSLCRGALSCSCSRAHTLAARSQRNRRQHRAREQWQLELLPVRSRSLEHHRDCVRHVRHRRRRGRYGGGARDVRLHHQVRRLRWLAS